jgi:hypothetical protein
MVDELLGSGLPTLITLTGENEYMGRWNIFRRRHRRSAPVSAPVVAANAISVVPPAPTPLTPAAIETKAPSPSPFQEQDTEEPENDSAENEEEGAPAEEMQGATQDFLFILAGAALLYIAAKNHFIRL